MGWKQFLAVFAYNGSVLLDVNPANLAVEAFDFRHRIDEQVALRLPNHGDVVGIGLAVVRGDLVLSLVGAGRNLARSARGACLWLLRRLIRPLTLDLGDDRLRCLFQLAIYIGICFDDSVLVGLVDNHVQLRIDRFTSFFWCSDVATTACRKLFLLRRSLGTLELRNDCRGRDFVTTRTGEGRARKSALPTTSWRLFIWRFLSTPIMTRLLSWNGTIGRNLGA